MRVLIVSDTHGSHRNLDAVLERVGKIDALIHMGDVENGEHYIEAVADCETYMVAGNNDFFSFLPKEREFTLESIIYSSPMDIITMYLWELLG